MIKAKIDSTEWKTLATKLGQASRGMRFFRWCILDDMRAPLRKRIVYVYTEEIYPGKRWPAVAFGEYINRIRFRIGPDFNWIIVYADIWYADILEYGSDGPMISSDPEAFLRDIEEWAKIKGIDNKRAITRIAKKLQDDGMEGQFIIKRSFGNGAMDATLKSVLSSKMAELMATVGFARV